MEDKKEEKKTVSENAKKGFEKAKGFCADTVKKAKRAFHNTMHARCNFRRF